MTDKPDVVEPRYHAEDLIEFATRIFTHAGLPEERARVVAATLVEADLMGHTTHGLQLLSPYVGELNKGWMKKTGEPDVIRDLGSAITLDGKYLPGPWLMHKALDLGFERAASHPVVTLVIRKSHHIACLATYPEQATQRGLMLLLACSDPRHASVAPFGGLEPVITPNPVAAGIPTEGDPIIFDISMSTTANGIVMRTHKEGKRLNHPWLLDSTGNPTNDPQQFFEEPPATILPLGGLDAGYKGFALGLLVEALTSGLAGFGRVDQPEGWGASVFLQIMNPDAFGGGTAFRREMQHLAESCLNSETPAGASPVRLPGTRALQLRAEQLQKGVWLYPTIVPSMQKWAESFGITLPAPI